MESPPVQITININSNLSGKDNEEEITNALVFDIDDIKRLRSLGICGVLSGSLPTVAQQNVFLSVPLRLMMEETVWLLKNGYASVNVVNRNSFSDILKNETVAASIHEESISRLNESFEAQKIYKHEKHLLKLKKLGIVEKHRDEDNQLLESSLFQETLNSSTILQHNYRRADCSSDDSLVNSLVSRYSSWSNYLVYQSLKNENYVVSPGARFGGKFIIYPGDPLRFHSHLIVSSPLNYYHDNINLVNIINGARLSTSVKKIWVISGIIDKEPEEKEVRFFSIEWAGFG